MISSYIPVRYVGTLTSMRRHMMSLVALRIVFAPAAEQSLAMMTLRWHTPSYVKSGSLKGCLGGVNIRLCHLAGILLDS